MTFIYNFLGEEEGQDLIECILLLAFVAFASSILFIGGDGSVNRILPTH